MANTTSILTAPPIRSDHWDDDAPVIQGRKIREDMVDLPWPTFGQPTWDMRLVAHLVNRSDFWWRLDFTLFDDPVRRMTAKELIMQRLNRPVPPLKPNVKAGPISVHTAVLAIYHIAHLYRFVDTIKAGSLRSLRQSHLDAYLRGLLTDGNTSKHHADIIKIAVWLYESRDLLTYDWIEIAPWGRKPLAQVVGATKGNRENKTERIPEPIMGPLLRWALTYIDRFSEDIISAAQENWTLDHTAPEDLPWGQARDRLLALIDEYRRSGRPLPARPDRAGQAPGPNRDLLVKLGKLPRYIGQYYATEIEDAARELGVAPGGLSTSPATIPEAGKPWREPFDTEEVGAEADLLVTACYIVCAYLSGMRDSEVQAIKVGAYQAQRGADGSIVRHKVLSRAWKGKDADQGQKRTWVVIEPVAKAIGVLERLTEGFRKETGNGHLFLMLRGGKSDNAALKGTVNARIQSFIDHINSTVEPRLRNLGIPPIPTLHDGQSFRITTRMFRRTVAWHIANRPFGVVAGMLQYGHTGEVAFEGYAGSSESGFRSEVEAERALARTADVIEMYDDYKAGIHPAGPMADELKAEFEHVRKTLGDFPGQVVDLKRREKMLDHLRTRLYPGLLADCFFDPKDALCLRHLKEADRREPVNGVCDPHCENACWTKKHLAVWEHTIDDTKRLAMRNRISPIQRDILRSRASEYEGIARAIREAAHAGQEVHS